MDQVQTQMFEIGNENLSMKYFRQAAWYISWKKRGGVNITSEFIGVGLAASLLNEVLAWVKEDIINLFGGFQFLYLILLLGVNIVILGWVLHIKKNIMERAKNPSVKTRMFAFLGFEKTFKARLLILLVSIFTSLGLGLLIIPGIIIGFRLFFSLDVLLDTDCSIRDAITRSWKITKGHFRNFVWFQIYFGFLSCILMVLCGIIAFIIPLISPIVAMKLGEFSLIVVILGYIVVFFLGISGIRTIPMQQIALVYYYYQISQLYDKNTNPQQVTQTQNISSFSPTQTLQPSVELPSEKKGSGIFIVIFLLIVAIVGGGYFFLKDRINFSFITDKFTSSKEDTEDFQFDNQGLNHLENKDNFGEDLVEKSDSDLNNDKMLYFSNDERIHWYLEKFNQTDINVFDTVRIVFESEVTTVQCDEKEEICEITIQGGKNLQLATGNVILIIDPDFQFYSLREVILATNVSGNNGKYEIKGMLKEGMEGFPYIFYDTTFNLTDNIICMTNEMEQIFAEEFKQVYEHNRDNTKGTNKSTIKGSKELPDLKNGIYQRYCSEKKDNQIIYYMRNQDNNQLDFTINNKDFPQMDDVKEFGDFIDISFTFSGRDITSRTYIDKITENDIGQLNKDALEKRYYLETQYPLQKISPKNLDTFSNLQENILYELNLTPENQQTNRNIANDLNKDLIVFYREDQSKKVFPSKKFTVKSISRKDKFSLSIRPSSTGEIYHFLFKEANLENILNYIGKQKLTLLSEHEIGKEYNEMSDDYFFNDTKKTLKLKIEDKTVTLAPNEIYLKDTFDRDFTILGEDTQKQISSKDKNSKKTEKSEGESKKGKSNNNNYYIIDNNDKDYPQGCNTVGLKDPSKLCILSLYADNSRNSRGNQRSGTLYISPAKFESLQNGDDAYTYCETLDLGGVTWEVPLSHEGAWSDIVKIQDKIYNLTAEGSEKPNHYWADNRSGDVASRHNCRLDGACGSEGSKSKLSVRCVTRDKPHFN